MKLLLQGKDKNEADASGEPYPIELPDEKKPVASTKVKEYLNAEFYYYYNIYTDTKYLGAPYPGGWQEYPKWYCQLVCQFDHAIEMVRAHNERKALKEARLGRP